MTTPLSVHEARQSASEWIRARCARGEHVEILLGVAEPGWDTVRDALERYAEWLIERDQTDTASLIGGVTYYFANEQASFVIRRPTLEERAELAAKQIRTWPSGKYFRRVTGEGIATLLEVLAQRSRRGVTRQDSAA